MIIDHTHPKYLRRWNSLGGGKYNGAYYYSREIVANIIPNVETDRNWITVNLPGTGCDHAIVFIHNNLHPQNYEWLKEYKDLVLVCGVKSTVDKVKHIGKAIYLPLSIDVSEVEQYRREDRSGVAYAGRPAKRIMQSVKLPSGMAILEGLERPVLLSKMARYETIYAVGRTAIEAKALGCEIGVYDSRYKDPSTWQVLDNKDAAKILQAELDKIDGKPNMTWTKAELLQYADDKGIEVKRADNKQTILEKLDV